MQTKSGGAWCNTMSIINGNVGIGAINPGAKLEISSPRNSTLLRLTAVSGENWDFKNCNAVGSTDVLSIGAVGATANLNLKDDGSVGIGASSPIARLHTCIGYGANNIQAVFGNSNGSINSQPYDTVIIQQDDVTTFKLVERNIGSVDQVLTITTGDSSSRISTTCANPLQFFVAGSPSACGYNGLSGINALTITSTGIACFAATVCAPLFTTTNGVAAIGAGPSSTEIFTATGPGSSNGMYLVIYSQQGTPGSATGMAYLNIWNNASVDVYNIFCQSLSNVTNSGTSVRIQTLSGNGGFTAVYSVIRLR